MNFRLALSFLAAVSSSAAAQGQTKEQCLAGVLHAQIIGRMDDTRDVPKGLAYADDCLKKFPNDVPLMVSRAGLYADLGDHAKSIAEYTKALRLDPHNAAALGGRGSANILKGDYKAALADLDAAIKRDPIARYFVNRGDVSGSSAQIPQRHARTTRVRSRTKTCSRSTHTAWRTSAWEAWPPAR